MSWKFPWDFSTFLLVWFLFCWNFFGQSNVTTLKNHKFENVNSKLSTFTYMDCRINLETHHEFTCFRSRKSISWCVKSFWKLIFVSIFENMSTWQIISPIFNAKNRSLDHSNRKSVQQKHGLSAQETAKCECCSEEWKLDRSIFPEIHHPMFFFQSFREFLLLFLIWRSWRHLRIWLAEWEHLGSATATRPSSVRRPEILMPQLICVGNGWNLWEVMVTNYDVTDFIDLVVANAVFMYFCIFPWYSMVWGEDLPF